MIFIPFFLGSSYQKRFTLVSYDGQARFVALSYYFYRTRYRVAGLLWAMDKIGVYGVFAVARQDPAFSGLTWSSDKIQRFGFTQENDKISFHQVVAQQYIVRHHVCF